MLLETLVYVFKVSFRIKILSEHALYLKSVDRQTNHVNCVENLRIICKAHLQIGWTRIVPFKTCLSALFIPWRVGFHRITLGRCRYCL